jgi:hypothetical protein
MVGDGITGYSLADMLVDFSVLLGERAGSGSDGSSDTTGSTNGNTGTQDNVIDDTGGFGGLGTGAAVGIACAAVAVVALIFAFILYRNRKNRRHSTSLRLSRIPTNGNSRDSTPSNAL